ncbi:MAG: serpin family protein, partial [Candidatus Marinimicrobia bacterium]|nr:serpin family protein [Candidatus Neomarinimicrobiota bacterium]
VQPLQNIRSGTTEDENIMLTQEQIVTGLNNFSFDLYHFLNTGAPSNIFYSPLSISSALAMTYAGAKGETAGQMQSTLHYGPQVDLFHSQYGAMIDSLSSKKGQDFEMNIANAIWVQDQFKLKDYYVETVKKNYNSEVRSMDFVGQPEASRDTINYWVEKKTAGKIQDLIPVGTIDGMTRMILTNAVYFNAEWANKFNKKLTNQDKFYCLNNKVIQTEMMYQRHHHAISQTKDYTILEIPYEGYEYSMLIILPKENNGLVDLVKDISADDIIAHDKNKKHEDVLVYIPKFKMETDYELKEPLSALGMSAAFSANADFSNMTGGKDLMISSVIHKAFIDVDEEKTEAAAATGVVMKLTSMAPSPKAPLEFRADHPFMFVIRCKNDNAILFIGQLINPES